MEVRVWMHEWMLLLHAMFYRMRCNPVCQHSDMQFHKPNAWPSHALTMNIYARPHASKDKRTSKQASQCAHQHPGTRNQSLSSSLIKKEKPPQQFVHTQLLQFFGIPNPHAYIRVHTHDTHQQIGIPVEEMSKLDANENLHPVPEEMMVHRTARTCLMLHANRP